MKLKLLTILVILFVASTLTVYAQIGEVEEEEGFIGEGEELEEGVIGEGKGLEEGVIGEEETELEAERDLPGFKSALALAGILAVALLLGRR